MGIIDSTAAHVLPSLSSLLGRELRLVAGDSPELSAGQTVRLPLPRMSVVAGDGRPFGDNERRMIIDLFDIIWKAHETEARFEELEQRMITLQRENLELIVKNRNLQDLSTRDTLTGLYNRWYVIDKLEGEINRALRHGFPMSVLMIDLDHFKRINDTYGHSTGDQVLQWVGKALRECCRVYDTPGRYGGEEFCVVLPETKVGNTSIVANRIRERLSSKDVVFGDVSLRVTASIGVAGVDSISEEGMLSPAALIDRADRALYSAKHRGRNRIELWESGAFEQAGTMQH